MIYNDKERALTDPQTAPRESVIYRGTATQGDLRENLALKSDGTITVTTRMRKRPVKIVRVVAVVLLGLAGAALLLTRITGHTPSLLLGGEGLMATLSSGLAAVGAAIYLLNRLYFTYRHFEAPSSIDQRSLETLDGLKHARSDVTRFLLDVAFASVRLERAEGAVTTARERARIAGSSERLDQVAERAEEELSQAREMKRRALARLVEFTADKEESDRGQWEKF